MADVPLWDIYAVNVTVNTERKKNDTLPDKCGVLLRKKGRKWVHMWSILVSSKSKLQFYMSEDSEMTDEIELAGIRVRFMDEIAAAKEAKNHAFELYNPKYSSTLERLACTTPRDFYQWVNALSAVLIVDENQGSGSSAAARRYGRSTSLPDVRPSGCLGSVVRLNRENEAASRVSSIRVLATEDFSRFSISGVPSPQSRFSPQDFANPSRKKSPTSKLAKFEYGQVNYVSSESNFGDDTPPPPPPLPPEFDLSVLANLAPPPPPPPIDALNLTESPKPPADIRDPKVYFAQVSREDKISIRSVLEWEKVLEVIVKEGGDEADIGDLFHIIDVDKDGRLSLSEFENFAAQLAKLVTVLLEDEKESELVHDDEYVTQASSVAPPLPPVVSAATTPTTKSDDDYVFVEPEDPEDEDSLVLDADGREMKRQYKALCKGATLLRLSNILAWGQVTDLLEADTVTEPEINRLFRRFDADSDGKLTLTGFRKFVSALDEMVSQRDTNEPTIQSEDPELSVYGGGDDVFLTPSASSVNTPSPAAAATSFTFSPLQGYNNKEAKSVPSPASRPVEPISHSRSDVNPDVNPEDQSTRELHKQFRHLSDQQGHISLKRVLQWREVAELVDDETLEESQVAHLFQKVDTDSDGRLSFEEFQIFLEKVNELAIQVLRGVESSEQPRAPENNTAPTFVAQNAASIPPTSSQPSEASGPTLSSSSVPINTTVRPTNASLKPTAGNLGATSSTSATSSVSPPVPPVPNVTTLPSPPLPSRLTPLSATSSEFPQPQLDASRSPQSKAAPLPPTLPQPKATPLPSPPQPKATPLPPTPPQPKATPLPPTPPQPISAPLPQSPPQPKSAPLPPPPQPKAAPLPPAPPQPKAAPLPSAPPQLKAAVPPAPPQPKAPPLSPAPPQPKAAPLPPAPPQSKAVQLPNPAQAKAAPMPGPPPAPPLPASRASAGSTVVAPSVLAPPPPAPPSPSSAKRPAKQVDPAVINNPPPLPPPLPNAKFASSIEGSGPSRSVAPPPPPASMPPPKLPPPAGLPPQIGSNVAMSSAASPAAMAALSELAEAKLSLQAAMKRVMDGDDSAETEVRRWEVFISTHPEYKREQEEALTIWEGQQMPALQQSLRRMREIIPPDIFHSSAGKMIEQGVPEDIARRIWTTKVLWLVRIHPDDLTRVHAAEFTTKYTHQGLDITELRAVYASVPKKIPNDAEGKKAQWLSQLRQKLQELTSREASNSLRLNEKRHPCYGWANNKIYYDPDAPLLTLESMKSPGSAEPLVDTASVQEAQQDRKIPQQARVNAPNAVRPPTAPDSNQNETKVPEVVRPPPPAPESKPSTKFPPAKPGHERSKAPQNDGKVSSPVGDSAAVNVTPALKAEQKQPAKVSNPPRAAQGEIATTNTEADVKLLTHEFGKDNEDKAEQVESKQTGQTPQQQAQEAARRLAREPRVLAVVEERMRAEEPKLSGLPKWKLDMAIKKLRSEFTEEEHARLKAIEDRELNEVENKMKAESEARARAEEERRRTEEERKYAGKSKWFVDKMRAKEAEERKAQEEAALREAAQKQAEDERVRLLVLEQQQRQAEEELRRKQAEEKYAGLAPWQVEKLRKKEAAERAIPSVAPAPAPITPPEQPSAPSRVVVADSRATPYATVPSGPKSAKMASPPVANAVPANRPTPAESKVTPSSPSHTPTGVKEEPTQTPLADEAKMEEEENLALAAREREYQSRIRIAEELEHEAKAKRTENAPPWLQEKIRAKERQASQARDAAAQAFEALENERARVNSIRQTREQQKAAAKEREMQQQLAEAKAAKEADKARRLKAAQEQTTAKTPAWAKR